MITRITQFLSPSNLLAAASMLISVVSFYWKTSGDIMLLENKSSMLDKRLDKMEIKIDRVETKLDEVILILARKNSFNE